MTVYPESTSTNRGSFPFLRGVNFGYLSKANYYGSRAAETEVDRMADAGVEWVSLLVMIMQEAYFSTRVYRDFHWTPPDRDIERIVNHCRKRGIRVLLKPIIDCLDSTWRGRIMFPDGEQQIQGIVTDYWSRWFESVREAKVYYAALSREIGIEAFTVSQELNGADFQTKGWRETIAAVRAVYPSWICANVSTPHTNPSFLEWVRDLDGIGFSNYVGVPIEHPTRDQIRDHIRLTLPLWREFQTMVNKPIYFAEFGCRSVSGGQLIPSEYRTDGAYDGQIQSDYIDGFLDAFSIEPWWRGFQLWKWEEQQNRPHYNKPEGDTGFTVSGKPAEAELRKWCSKR